MRSAWQKPGGTNAKAPIPLQSKNGYPPQGTPNRAPYPPSRYNEVSPEYPGPPPQQMQHRPSYDQGDRGKPISVEDERDGVYGRSSPPDSTQKSAYGKAVRPYPSHPPHMSKYQSENGHRGSVYEIPPDAPDQSMHPPVSVHRTNSTASQYSAVGHPPTHNNTPPNHNNVQAIAQAAATHPVSLRPSPQRRNDQYTEREKMLKGLYYYPMSPALTQDREHCIAAIWRFNNATNPSHGASPEERCRLFRQILSLRPTPEPAGPNGEVPRQNIEPPFGSVGERVVVEAPFHCDYGYNITVGDDVLIGADCRISDTCSVTIGARCIFSPNVKLVCATYPIDPRRRMGSNGPALGRNIVIEEDCWIGSNVTILAGVRVGKSSTVGAGSLLHQVSPFGWRHGNQEANNDERTFQGSPSLLAIQPKSVEESTTAMRTANKSYTTCHYDTTNCLHHSPMFTPLFHISHHDHASRTILQDFIRWPRDQRTCYKSPIARDRIGHFRSNRHGLLFYSLAPIPAYLLAHRLVRDVENATLDRIDVTLSADRLSRARCWRWVVHLAQGLYQTSSDEGRR